MSEILRLENVTTGYDGDPVLRDVSLTVHKGEVLAIIGQNGSGKSTLLKTIARIISNNSGSIIINGVKIDRLKPWQLGKYGLAYSMQTGNIFPTLTVDEHFSLALRKTNRSDATSIREACITHFPELGALMNRRAGNLSGGQRQMLGFAMLLCQQADIWLLDEPTAGLSPDSVGRSVEYLKSMKLGGQTMLIVEHNYNAAFELANDVAIVKHGQLTKVFPRHLFTEQGFLDNHLYD